MNKILELGGVVKAIQRGYIQQEIHESAYLYQKQIEEGKQVVVGVNQYQEDEDLTFKLLRVDPEVERYQVEQLKDLKGERSSAQVKEALLRIKGAAEGEENLLPALIKGVESLATLGEICSVLREVFGEHRGAVL